MPSSDPYVTPESIPTLSDLYRTSELPLAPPNGEEGEEPEYEYDENLNRRVCIWRGDITKLKTEMIVNAANRSLLGGGGVDGAIHSAAGPELLEECRGLGGGETGETKVTGGYELPAKYIAHTVGPIYATSRAERCEQQLESCYQTSLERCVEYGGGGIGFSSISTGVYGFPIVDATCIALQTTREFLSSEAGQKITRVVYVVFSKKDEDVYRRMAPIFFPPPPSTPPS